MKHKKNLKGFTLVEMLIAMTVFAIMAMMMVMVFSSVCYLNIKNHKTNVAMQTQGDKIENKDDTGAVANGNPTITFTYGGTTADVKFDKEIANKNDVTGDYHFSYLKPTPTP